MHRRRRTQPRRHQDRRLGHRPGAGWRGERRRHRRGGDTGSDRSGGKERDRFLPETALRKRARRHAGGEARGKEGRVECGNWRGETFYARAIIISEDLYPSDYPLAH